MPMETDSQAVQSHKMSLNVRFQSAYHKTKNLYGDNVEALVKQYLLREIKPPSKEISDLVKEMRMKMIGAGLMPKEAAEESVSSPAPASERAPEPAPAPAPAPASAIETKSDESASTPAIKSNLVAEPESAPSAIEEVESFFSCPYRTAATVGAVAIVFSLAAYYMRRRE